MQMPHSFIGRVSGLAALLGFAFIVILAGFGYSLSVAFRADDEALSTYAEEMILGGALEDAVQRKLADGRTYLLTHREEARAAFERASADEQRLFAELHARVKSQKGIRLLDTAERAAVAHDRALRAAMAMPGPLPDEIARNWAALDDPLASELRTDMDAFIRYKGLLYQRAKENAYRVQRRSVVVSSSIALLALLAGIAGGIFLLRSARNAFRLQTSARTAADKERSFYEALVDQLPIGIVAADASEKIIQVSQWARLLFARENPRLLEAQRVADYAQWPWHRGDDAALTPRDLALSRALRGEVVQQLEVRGSGGRVYSVTGGPIRDRTGAIVAAVCGFVDITERKQAEHERELLLGVLGHDLRNPLNAILLAAETLQRRSDLPGDAIKPAARIASSAKRMNRLIGELLDFARSRHGVIAIKPEPCELADIATEIVDELRATNPDRDIRIATHVGCDGVFDASRIAQVLQNLIGNALQHGAPDHPVEVETGCSDDGDVVWVRVTNRGANIPHDERQRIFEPFRTHDATKGLGLGLYIARAIVQAHGGTIAVESEDGTTTFRLELPRNGVPVARVESQTDHQPAL